MMFDPFQVFYRQTQLSLPEKSLAKRTAKLRLSEDGTLEGDARMEYTGHFAVEKKEENDDLSPDKREQNFIASFKEQMSAAEISNVRIENVNDSIKPIVYSFHVRVPDYAHRTGKRLFFEPAFFQNHSASPFSASERKYPIYFHYPWSELDTVEIELPPGFALENAETPAPFTASTAGKYEVKIGITNDKRTLIYRRNFSFGAGAIVFPQSSYGPLKQMFETRLKEDNHTITLRHEMTAN